MSDTLRQTWNDIAYAWDDWGPPLRPDAEDLRHFRLALVRWQAEVRPEVAEVFLCGVTPEIVTMDWPFPIHLIGVDRSESMVRVVWPGDIPGVRRGLVGNWLRPPVPPHSQDVVLLDGGIGFFDYPDGQRALLAAMHRMLRPRGLVVLRLYAQAERRETLAEVLQALRAGQIGNFHVFKWRVAAALQPDTRRGVKQDEVWRACTEAGLDPSRLPQPGWSPQALATIRFYEGKETPLYFPTLAEFRALVAERFQGIEVVYPSYELGERCPFVIARPRTPIPDEQRP